MLPSGARKCTQAFPLSSTPDSKRISTPAERNSAVAAWMSSTRNPRDRAGGEVAVDVTVASKDLDLAAVRQLQHLEPRTVQVKRKAQACTTSVRGRVVAIHPREADLA